MEGLNLCLCFRTHSVHRVQLLQHIPVKLLVTLIHEAKIQGFERRKQPVCADSYIIHRKPTVEEKSLWVGGRDAHVCTHFLQVHNLAIKMTTEKLNICKKRARNEKISYKFIIITNSQCSVCVCVSTTTVTWSGDH